MSVPTASASLKIDKKMILLYNYIINNGNIFMKKIIVLMSVVLFMGAGCSAGVSVRNKETGTVSNADLVDKMLNEAGAKENAEEDINKTENDYTDEKNDNGKKMKLWEPIPKLDSGVEYYRSHGKVIGQVKVKFLNKETGKTVAGHSIDCVSCIDSYMKE